jgi:starch phosphorylase
LDRFEGVTDGGNDRPAVPIEVPTDLTVRVEELEAHLVSGLRPLARLAYNYRWSWLGDGADVFAAVDPHRWQLAGQNPVLFLRDLPRQQQRAAEQRDELVSHIRQVAEEVAAELAEPLRPRAGLDGPVVFLCSEFGVHTSLPTYSGGLGVLAGDFLKEASDQRFPLLGVGLLYRRGYFQQRLDLDGRQQEYWLQHEPDELPVARILRRDGAPLQLTVPLFGRPLAFQAWRLDVGHVPLLLLDAELPENDLVQRWTTARLYDAEPRVRLAQYGLLGIGAARLLAELAIEPAVLHLNEGHPALAPLELAARAVQSGATLDGALEALRPRIVFTTHTPVPAGNETYPRELFLEAFGDLPARLGVDDERLLALCRVLPDDADGAPGMSPLAMRIAGRRNGVSRVHGEVARAMWQPMFPNDTVPIDHVTNGAHLPTFLSEPLRRLYARHLAEGGTSWDAVRAIPNEELWRARCEARERLVAYGRSKAVQDRLVRGEDLEYVREAERLLNPDVLTLGFARRLAGYKRLNLLLHDAERAVGILKGPPPVQLIVAGKAHPRDDDGKRLLQLLFQQHQRTGRAGAGVFLENYELAMARELVAGCDVWLNLPRRPMEASGTSGMKATFNGVLQLSVLDGWWAEAYNGSNGWAIPGSGTTEEADAEDAAELYRLLEDEVIPLFYERDAAGVPHGWCELIKEALVSCAGRFTATRMVNEYVDRMYLRLPATED